MNVSIITPSFKQPEWLRLCMASVADQEGVAVEHIIQDNCSGAEVERVASGFPKAGIYVEPDRGMYDAVNKGLQRAGGDICGYLNCDEQYLPGALKKVHDYFEANPDVEVVFADAVVTDSNGGYMCSRQVMLPLYYHTMVCHLNTLTCATFFRRSVIRDRKLCFDPRWKDLGDSVWVLSLLENSVKAGVMRFYTTAFTDTGENMNMKPNARREVEELKRKAPGWISGMARVLVLHHRFRRLIHGLYWPQPFSYAVYTRNNPEARTAVEVSKPRFLWTNRLSWTR
jgi:glycosyltransferase involved in cell wall biosynthesis